MKLILASIILASTQAFAPNAVPFLSRQGVAFALHSTLSSEEAIQDAMRLSKEKGATSSEARVAWDIVEEIDASDNSAAFKGGINDDDCFIGEDDTPPEECVDYAAGVEAVVKSAYDALETTDTTKADSEKSIAEGVRPISLSSSSSSSGSADSAEVNTALLAALENAKKLTAELGITSSEAKLAWEDVEEIASSSTSQATKKPLNLEECEVEKIEACEALEELDRVISLNANKD